MTYMVHIITVYVNINNVFKLIEYKYKTDNSKNLDLVIYLKILEKY